MNHHAPEAPGVSVPRKKNHLLVGSEMSFRPLHHRILLSLLLIVQVLCEPCQNIYSAYNFEESEFNADYVYRGFFNAAPYYANFMNHTCLWRYTDGDWIFGYCEDINTEYGVYYYRPSDNQENNCNWAKKQNWLFTSSIIENSKGIVVSRTVQTTTSTTTTTTTTTTTRPKPQRQRSKPQNARRRKLKQKCQWTYYKWLGYRCVVKYYYQ